MWMIVHRAPSLLITCQNLIQYMYLSLLNLFKNPVLQIYDECRRLLTGFKMLMHGVIESTDTIYEYSFMKTYWHPLSLDNVWQVTPFWFLIHLFTQAERNISLNRLGHCKKSILLAWPQIKIHTVLASANVWGHDTC